MTGTGDAQLRATATEWRTESRFYRRAPGLGWLLGLLLIPLLLGWLGWGALKPKTDVTAPGVTVSAPSVSVPSVSVPSVSVPSVSVPAMPAGSCGDLQSRINTELNTPITYETDGYDLTPASRTELTAIAGAIKACPDVKIAVIGHTDNTGSDAVNVPLSNDRAKSVAAYLVSQGVPAGSVSSRGEGSSNPVAGNDTAAGRAQNRRTEIKVS
jgi:peptidoglycan-binding protein ArfA